MGCAAVLAERRANVVVLRWSDEANDTQRVRITGYDRPGLLHDITALLAEREVSIVATQASTDHRRGRGTAGIDLEIEVGRLSELARIIDGMRRIPGVIDARRGR
jgi:(p)ppGpp synthase/HD superfamily hydrolase